MRWVFSYLRVVMVSLVLTNGAAADAPADIESTISQQFQAFQRDDFTTAFDFASPMIQRIFRTPDGFGQMVRNGYPMVWRPKAYNFLTLQDTPDGYAQTVEIIDQQGIAHYLRYYMVNLGGQWRINGVEILRGNPLAV